MEYVAGGNMADYILKTILLKFGSFDTRDGLVMEEDEARYFFMQIINAVDYCHKNKVAHRWGEGRGSGAGGERSGAGGAGGSVCVGRGGLRVCCAR